MSLAAGFLQGLADGKNASEDRKLRRREIEAMEKSISNDGPRNTGFVPGGGGGGSNNALFGLIDATEGAGNYDTLYSHSQRDGGQFAGTKVSAMPLSDVYAFSDPNGAYGQWVAGQNNGTIATPMGRHQIVGRTLRAAASELGLPDNTVFDAKTQDAIADHLATKRLRGASDMPSKIAALRQEWQGFRNVPDDKLAAAITAFEGGNTKAAQATPAKARPSRWAFFDKFMDGGAQ